jgi:glycosyltransferase involved in cell wall biosynthesis
VLQLFEPPDGGVAAHVLGLALGLGDHGYEVELAGPQDAVIWPGVRDAGLPVHILPFRHGFRAPQSDARVFARLVPFLRQHRYDLVHCHSSKAGASGRVAAALAGTPSIYTPHGFAFKAGHPLVRVVFLSVEFLLARGCRQLICVSEDERRLAERRLRSSQRLVVVNNGTATCPPGGEADADLSALRGEGPLAAAITVMRPEKGLDVVLAAVPHVLARMPQARLAVVGSGPMEAHYRRVAQPLLDDPRFRLLSFAPPVERYLRAIDVFVLASDREGLPIGILEAMACGVPQVATAVGGTPEAVSDETGVLVPPRDPEALAAAIVELLSDPARRERAAAASRRRHLERFTLERMVEQTASVYDRVLAGS